MTDTDAAPTRVHTRTQNKTTTFTQEHTDCALIFPSNRPPEGKPEYMFHNC